MFSDAQVGDSVLVVNNFGYKSCEIIDKVLKFHIVTTSGIKYRKKDGSRVTSGCYRSRITHLIKKITYIEYIELQKQKQKKHHDNLACDCSKIDFKSLSDETLTKILEIVNNQ